MAFIGTILQETVKMRKSLMADKHQKGSKLQLRVLKKLLDNGRVTQFGKHYGFAKLLDSKNIVQAFQEAVPIHDYNKIHNEWWIKAQQGQESVCWPGKTKFFALTSGTSEAASKKVPLTLNMIRAIRKTSIRQTYTLSELDLPRSFFDKSILMLAGSTALNDQGYYMDGDLSGILVSKLPVWVYKFYKPSREVSRIKDWNLKLDLIVKQAKDWDIGIITGVPAWYQLLFDKMLKYYKVDNIHEIWPNLKIFVHGGVAFEPYKKSFGSYLGKEILYLETYLASEGFMAYQVANKEHMQLVLDNGIFFEFIPFDAQNFNDDGTLKDNPIVYTIADVEENVPYALIISTCAGAWRYIIGDVVKIINKKTCEIIICGRTKMFLSLCGEHLSLDNMSKAIALCSSELNISINEFAVAGTQERHHFGHHWYMGIDNNIIKNEKVAQCLDKYLKQLNDDYATERKHALKNMEVEILPTEVFYDWMKHMGKFGGQNKFPRVLKGDRLKDWQEFIHKSHSTVC